jgi:hypothetical protein
VTDRGADVVNGTEGNIECVVKWPDAFGPPGSESRACSQRGCRVFEATQFLYTTSGIQTGVAPGTITRRQAAVIRGSVRTAGGQPLPDVRISILNATSYGQTRTRSDGGFDFAVNGGSPLTVHYEKSGYIAADRSVAVPWNDYAFAPDVVLIPYDAAVTPVDLTSATVTVARGSAITDSDGARQATLLFQTLTTASLAFANGSAQPITSLHVRATEYTVGPTGPAAMPADLPPTTAYTYCVELSADEAVEAGATGVQFSKPVPFYLENFLNFPVGQIVPVGFYERQTGRWIPSDNGRVVQIVAITAGRAYLDVDGDGMADDSDTLIATTPAERDQLATMYSAGQTLWRVALSHFPHTTATGRTDRPTVQFHRAMPRRPATTQSMDRRAALGP